jgi:hypothetical protein
MKMKRVYRKLEELASQADEVRTLSAQNMPVATKNAAVKLYADIVALQRRIERLLDEDLES